MSSNRNFTSTSERPKNGYSRDDVLRIASDYKNMRIKLISEAAKLCGKEVGEIGEVVSPRTKKKDSLAGFESPLKRKNVKKT
ncbi:MULTISPECIES: hypothetical protein [Rahnella]|jgi:hypothetical protein|uniref:hypothetical protein n=1 Tax=Rahnella TaxID=34037 RepID=UPI00130035C0|nr:hypothetical protein [Rahnella sp. NRRL B-41462]CAH0133516.1 hypothetical protein SRABI106_00047 [Rahnella aquatilis]